LTGLSNYYARERSYGRSVEEKGEFKEEKSVADLDFPPFSDLNPALASTY
jgi:hypothetical protein